MHSAKIALSILALLVIIIGSSLIGANILSNTSDKLSGNIEKVESSTTSEDWNNALKYLDDIEKDWSKSEGIWSILIDHIEIDNIENSLTRMKKYIEVKDRALALGEIANLKQYVKHIPQKETFNFRNVF